ncbi:MAG: hypothetical protein RIR01_342 [Bacteroidota bacterium]
MVSKEAEERRLKFLASKESAGGSFAALMKQELSKKPKVYFLKDGTIVSITKEEIEVNSDWQCREFDDEQIQILEDKNWNLFYIKKDPLVDNLYSIESRPLESTVVSAENNSLMLIDISSTYDCKCTLTSSNFTVELSDNLLEKYKDIDPVNATANGHKILKFYFTAKNDPHIMLHSEYISLRQLLINKSIVVPIKNIPLGCSIYTVKAFEKYSRV